MSQNEDVEMSEYDDEASLAFARKLQDEYDRLAFASSAVSTNDDFKLSNKLSGDLQSDAHTLSAIPSKGKQPMTDEEYARFLANDQTADYRSSSISDEEFARLLQMQEDPTFNFSSPFPPTPQSRSPNDKDPFSVLSPPQQPPPHPHSPHISPPLHQNPSTQNAPPYATQIVDDGQPPAPSFRSPTAPSQPPPSEYNDWGDPAIDESLRLAHQLFQKQNTPPFQSTTVHQP